ncbi:MAG TPA: hypothetical protein VMW52_07450 [Phycisphaerae bacterium]|nr:hypothetical protein [Phycisphaerae bacterium]
MKRWMLLIPLAGLVATGAAPAAPDARAPLSVDDLKVVYESASDVVQFQIESVQANPTAAPRLVWEVRGPILETFKGRLLPGTISVHVESVVRSFDLPRAELVGRQFIVAIKPLSEQADRRFQLVGNYGFEAASAEATALRELAEAEAQRGSGGENLRLSVRPLEQVFQVEGPKTVEIRLTNEGSDSAMYLQAPLAKRDGQLYLTGQGAIRIRDLSGRIVPDKGKIVTGQVPPPPPTPALILPKASFVETLDLAKYYDLSAGRYTLVVMLATPTGNARIPSNGLSFQVGAVNLPEVPPTPELIGLPAAEAGTTPAPPAAKEQVDLPAPASYKPGEAVSGLAGLLRPAKSHYALGEPIEVEFRLINQGPRSLAVDARLERALTVTVTPAGNSAEPLFIRQIIPWADDGNTVPEARAFLREGAFWGRTLNLNVLFGKSLDAFPAPTPEEISAGKDLSYERFGRNLFGFNKAGVYRVTATYRVARSRAAEAAAGAGPPSIWWTGDLETNAVTIQILGRSPEGGP